ncbi:RDD family protein [Salinicoccus cyprini]|uniref:RDD family protein n=1 Tax=Salinicoccus cyprini TaxID=2493691 RepID=A0A558AZN9_9STAP|nr:RDD family protein [Salinicoccus cyprini]TVT29704.1 RDD family protein [Salinicoccus cyprini]
MEHNERYRPETNDSLSDKLDYMATAHFFTRAISYIIDIIILWSISQILIYPILNVLDIREAYLWIPFFSADSIMVAVIYFTYFVLMTHFFQATLGKMITGISVISQNGGRLTFVQVIYRELVGRFICNRLFYLPYLMIIFTENRIGLHDFFADTHVVKNNYQSYKNMIKSRYMRETYDGQ